jgi:uncharacterized protein
MSVRSDRLLKGFVLLLLLILALVPASSGLAQVPTPTPAAAGTPMATPSPAAPQVTPRENLTLAPGVAGQNLTIDLAGFPSKAQLTYPANGSGPFPTVILIPGSGPEDLNAAICAFGANPLAALSHNFFDIADYLSAHGYAVLRYCKRYVTGPCQTDCSKFATLTLQDMLSDAGKVLDVARSQKLVDGKRIFLYGWSEGSTVAAGLAAGHPDLAGLLVQGPVTLPWRDIFAYQFVDVSLPYLRLPVPDGRVTPDTIRQVAGGLGGLVAKEVVLYIASPASFSGTTISVNPFFDKNNDGVIDIDGELLPNFNAYLDTLFQPGGSFGIYAASRALPTVTEQAVRLNMPLLILQGENDANGPAWGARLLDVALVGNTQHRLIFYPGLGHSLGPAPNRMTDNFQPIGQAPLADILLWLDAQKGA